MTDPADEKHRGDEKNRADEEARESGRPGGGKGRKDEVGKSGVYPMSGPLPQGPAELRTPAAWGQGERGAAGYEDSGRSELVYEQGQLLGGLDAGAPGSPPPAGLLIPPPAWEKALDDFSRQHRNCPVLIEEIRGEERRVAIENEPLTGISADRAGERDKIYVAVGSRPGQSHTHVIAAPRQLRIFVAPGEAPSAEVESADGTRTRLRCLEHRPAA